MWERTGQPRTGSICVALIVCAALLGSAACSTEQLAAGRNVIVISIDSLRADHLGCYGYEPPTSPTLDALAHEGTLFRHAYAPSPWTLPSHASLFSGLDADTHGLVEESFTLRADADTLAGRLRDNGYRTGAVVCAPLLRTDFGLGAGFDDYDTELIARTYEQARLVKVGPEVTRKALRWIDRRDEQPFFLFLHYWDVHYDYNPPPDYTAMFDPDYAGPIDGIDIYNRTDIAPGMDPRDLEHLVALYDGEIRYTDDAVRELLDGLAQRGLDRNTMVWITSDHGEEFLDHGGTGHTRTCYEELVRIPLIARIPWLETHESVVEGPVSLIDLFPTILDLLDVDQNGLAVQGVSLAGAIESGEPLAPRRLMAQTVRGKLDPRAEDSLVWTSTVGPDRLKLHQLHAARGPSRYLLYDLEIDPTETGPPHTDAATLRELGAELHRMQREHLALRQQLDLSRPLGLDEELLETLRGLGYVR